VQPLLLTVKLLEKDEQKFGEKTSVEPDGIPGEILNLGGLVMNPFVARTLEISLNNTTIPRDWKIFIADHI
jgi:hypothetical protein